MEHDDRGRRATVVLNCWHADDVWALLAPEPGTAWRCRWCPMEGTLHGHYGGTPPDRTVVAVLPAAAYRALAAAARLSEDERRAVADALR